MVNEQETFLRCLIFVSSLQILFASFSKMLGYQHRNTNIKFGKKVSLSWVWEIQLGPQVQMMEVFVLGSHSKNCLVPFVLFGTMFVLTCSLDFMWSVWGLLWVKNIIYRSLVLLFKIFSITVRYLEMQK